MYPDTGFLMNMYPDTGSLLKVYPDTGSLRIWTRIRQLLNSDSLLATAGITKYHA